jgi:hypothetical protein
MKNVSRFLACSAFVVAASLLAACSGDDDTGPTATAALSLTAGATQVAEGTPTSLASTAIPGPATPTPAPAATATPTDTAGLEALSLVYVDTRRGQGGDIFIADAGGANPRLILSEPAFRRPLDVAGSTLAAVGQTGVMLIDLDTGEPALIEETEVVFDGGFFDDETFLYSSSGGCTPAGGSLYRIDLLGAAVEELVASELSLTIVGTDPATNTVALLPRGCDVGIAAIEVYDATTGALRNSFAVEGCGWAIAALDQGKAVTSWQSCTRPDDHLDADATVYDFGIVGPTGIDVTVPGVESNAAIWLPRPAHAEVALGATVGVGIGPGSARGAGIYILDLATRQFAPLVEGEGAEQYPVGWSPDGRYLLYAIVEAQGVCHYAYVDAESDDPQPVPVNPDITMCGVNGNVVGWTVLR